MKSDDPLFNIHFIRLVKKRPCIWNYTLVEYSKRNVTEQAWTQIAEEVKESVPKCRERWRNIRGAFLRALKHAPSSSGSTATKKYYLNDHLQFLVPYIKHKTRNLENFKDADNFEDDALESDDELGFQEIGTELLDDSPHDVTSDNEEKPYNLHESASLSTSRYDIKDEKLTLHMETSDASDNAFVERFQINKEERRTMDENPNLLFFRSLLPDIMKMTSKQNRRFRQKIIGLIDDILEDADIEPANQSASVSTLPLYTNQS